MKTFKIHLTESEYKGIKGYLKSTDDYTNDNDIQIYLSGLVDSLIHCPREAVSDFVKIFENNQ